MITNSIFDPNWRTIKLGNLEAQGVLTLGRGEIISRIEIEKTPGPYPVYSSSIHNNGVFGNYGKFMFDEELITWSVDGGGNFFYRPKHKFSVTNVSGYIKINNKNQMDYRFLFYVLDWQHSFLSFDYTIKAHPSVIRPLYEVPLIDLKEQSIIADVLSTIDRAIAQTEALIAKHQRIKTGLMQDLLTHGIDEHGQLRDPSTHKFKPTPLGIIPEEWDVSTLGSYLDKNGGFVQTGPFGSQLHAEEYVPSGIPTIMPKDIIEGQILTDAIDHITEEKANSLARHRVIPNDVIFARRGDLSRTAPISDREKGWLCGTGCFLLRAPLNKLDATWLAMTYRFPSIQRQVMAKAIGSTMLNLNGQVMKSLIFAFPTFDEQVAIVERLFAQSKIVFQNIERANKLFRIKQGLMQDLLSGKVPVTPLLEE